MKLCQCNAEQAVNFVECWTFQIGILCVKLMFNGKVICPYVTLYVSACFMFKTTQHILL